LRKLDVKAESWPIAGSFTIARGSKTVAETVVVTLTENGFIGRGESVPYSRYNETVPQCISALENARQTIEIGLNQFQVIKLNLPKAAQNALDCATLDLIAKKSGVPVWQSQELQAPMPAITAYTLSLDTPEAMGKAAANASHYPLLKLKLGRDGDVERLAAIREAVPKARLIVDANEGWSPAILPARLNACEKYGVELVEQPLPADNDEALRGLARNTMICADESAHDVAGLSKLIGKYDAINIKLDKTGGLTSALALATAAKALNFKVMVGCMLATSLAMAPAFLLAQLADYVDLDGPLLLAKDRDNGIEYKNGIMSPPRPELWG
jgi:L-alanine-DL-glutamate epimerase-like enolase superfamily enzyme